MILRRLMFYDTSSEGEQTNTTKKSAPYPSTQNHYIEAIETRQYFLTAEHLAEFNQSAINPELALLNFQSFDGFPAFSAFITECEFNQKDRINTGALRQYWLNKYNHLYQGYWAVWGLNPITGELEIHQVKPNQPRCAQIGRNN